MVCLEGFEPPTIDVEDLCAIQLRHRHKSQIEKCVNNLSTTKYQAQNGIKQAISVDQNPFAITTPAIHANNSVNLTNAFTNSLQVANGVTHGGRTRILRIMSSRHYRYAKVTSNSGGDGRIRTHGAISDPAHFKCAAIDHSATSPMSRIISQIS